MAVAPASATKRGPGRPRDPDVEERLKRATLESLAEHGISGLTLEKICERAGVPRATFYRRWATPMEAVAEAFNEALRLDLPPDSGDVVQDLVALGQAMVARYSDPVLGPCMSFLLAEGRVYPALIESHRAEFPRRRASNRSIVERAMARGEISPDTDPDLVIDVISGLAMNNSSTNRPLTAEMLAFVVRRLLNMPD